MRQESDVQNPIPWDDIELPEDADAFEVRSVPFFEAAEIRTVNDVEAGQMMVLADKNDRWDMRLRRWLAMIPYLSWLYPPVWYKGVDPTPTEREKIEELIRLKGMGEEVDLSGWEIVPSSHEGFGFDLDLDQEDPDDLA